MAKIDEVKEILNTLRLLFSLGVGLVVVTTGALISKEQSSQVDIYFWAGSLVDALLVVGLVLIVRAIKRYMQIIGTL